MKPIDTYLIHGTMFFGSKPTWIDEDSDLPSALKKRLGTALTLKPLRWSGANSFAARMAAQKSIIEELSNFDFDKRSCIICSHSHGGSAVAYALRDRPDLAERITGAIFLSTPFVTFRILQNWRYLLDGLLAPIALAGLLIIFNIAFYLCVPVRFLMSDFNVNSGSTISIVPALIFSTIIFFGTAASLALLIQFNRSKLTLAQGRLRAALRLRERLSAHIPPRTNAIFIRVSGDEAATFLVLMQQLAWWMSALNVLVARIYALVAWPWRIKRVRNVEQLLIVLVAWSLIAGFAFAELWGRFASNLFKLNISWAELIRDVKVSFAATWHYQTSSGLYELRVLLPIILYVGLFWIVAATLSFLIISFSISLVFFLANWLVGIAFGRFPFLSSGILQAAAEPTPPGEWPLLHVTWSGHGRKRQRLLWRHSNPYANPKVVGRIVDWIEMAARSLKPATKSDSAQ